MPNWRKVIVSGSDAYLNSVFTPPGVVNSFTASYALASLSASNALTAVTASHLFGTASQALTASYSAVASTASFAHTASSVNMLRQTVIVSGSVNAYGGIGTSGSYNLLAATGQNLFFNNSGQLGSTGTGWHIQMTPNGNTTYFNQVGYHLNGLNVQPGGNSTTYGLSVSVGSYPSATIATFASGSTTALTISGSGMRGTGSFSYLGGIAATSFTGSLLGTASAAISASWAPSTPAFPHTGSARITGSLSVTGSTSISGSLTLQDVLVAQYLSIANYSGDDEAAAAGIPLWGIYRTGNMLVVRMT